jgi:hypothetical protein
VGNKSFKVAHFGVEKKLTKAEHFNEMFSNTVGIQILDKPSCPMVHF